MSKKEMIREKATQLQNIINYMESGVEVHLKNFKETKDNTYIERLEYMLKYDMELIKKYAIFIEILNDN